MATVTHKVVKGDTLSAIARKYGTTVDAIAKLNNIKNVNLIYIGQVLYISGKPASATTGGTNSSGGSSSGGTSSGGSSSSATSETTINTYTSKIYEFGIQANSDNLVFGIWYHGIYNTETFEVEWDYCTSDGKWFSGARLTKKAPAYLEQVDDTYSPPSNATAVRLRIRAISLKYKKNVNGVEQEVSYFIGNWSPYSQVAITKEKEPYVPGTPPTPTVSIEGYTLTVSVDNLSSAIEWTGEDPYIEFEILKNNVQAIGLPRVKIVYFSASYSCPIDAGYEYKARCRILQGSAASPYSQYSSNTSSQPSAPGGITICRASSETSVYLQWKAVSSAKTYDIEYATKKEYLGESNNSTTINSIGSTQYEVTGLESGEQYFFRVRAVNNNGSSAWTEAVTTIIGAKPTAPTTWSSTTTVISGEELVLYWMHNTTDNSKESKAELEIYFDGNKTTKTVYNTSTSDEQSTSEYKINTASYKEGTVIKWRVRTAGITGEYGDWSVQRTINVYAPATLFLTVTDVDGFHISRLTKYPMYIKGIAGPSSQDVISYNVQVIAKDSYETVDELGRIKMVLAGDAVYSKYYDIDDVLLLELTPGSIDLHPGITYSVQCMSTMNTGLSASDETSFYVDWEDELYAPNAEIFYDSDKYITHIRPFCDYIPYECYQVVRSGNNYTVTSTKLPILDGESMDGIVTTDGDIVYSGKLNSSTVMFCIRMADNPTSVPDVELSVYRREHDGKFTLIQDGIINGSNTFVTDPHPSLDYARYRIVARSTATGAISYSDLSGYEIREKAVIIQWAEEWSEINIEGNEIAKPAWSGSLLKLMYNIDISERNEPDMTTVEYIGREHPVSYYGTQVGTKATWSMEIPKNDKDTLYALRRLAVYMGDVYVREPSGSGYWANINVSFKQAHRELVIPITIEIIRVSGGI